MDNAIELTGLCKEFKDFTLKDMIARNSGNIRIFGMDNILEEQIIKQDIGAVFDEVFFVDRWKVSEVEKAVKSFYGKWSSPLYNKYVSSFALPADKKVKDLSRGMKMKLMLAVAMSHEAKLLILDEPTSGLDSVARDELLDILSAYISDGEKTILFSTHITSDLEKIADYITLIDNGRIFYTGTKDDLLESFHIIKGGLNDLKDQLQERIIGLIKNSTGFSGLIPASETRYLSKEIVAVTPSIDDM